MLSTQRLLARGGRAGLSPVPGSHSRFSQNAPTIGTPRFAQYSSISSTFSYRRPALQSSLIGAIPLTISSSIGTNKRTFFWGGSKPSPASDNATSVSDLVEQPSTITATTSVTMPSTGGIDGAVSNLNTFSDATSGVASVDVTSITPAIPTSIDFGYLHSIGLEYGIFHPAAYAEWLLEYVHIYAQTPWWASIAIAAISIRLALVPLTIQSQITADRLQQSTKFTKPITDELMKAYVSKNSELIAAKTVELREVRKLSGAPNPLSLFYNVFIQGWVGYGGFRLLYDMAKLPVPGLEVGGYDWFIDIAASDPSYVLPVATWAIMSASTTISRKLLPPAVENPQVTALAKLVPFVAGASSAFFPGTVQIFIFFSAAFQSLIQLSVALPQVRRLLGLVSKPPGGGAPVL